MPDLVSIGRIHDARCPPEDHGVVLLALHTVQEDRPVQLPHLATHPYVRQLVLQDQGDVFAHLVPGIDQDLEAEGHALPIDHLVKKPVPVRVVPARFCEQIQGPIRVVAQRLETGVVLGPEHVDRALHRFPKAEQQVLDHAVPIGQMRHRAPDALVAENRVRVVPPDVEVARRVIDGLEETAHELG